MLLDFEFFFFFPGMAYATRHRRERVEGGRSRKAASWSWNPLELGII